MVSRNIVWYALMQYDVIDYTLMIDAHSIKIYAPQLLHLLPRIILKLIVFPSPNVQSFLLSFFFFFLVRYRIPSWLISAIYCSWLNQSSIRLYSSAFYDQHMVPFQPPEIVTTPLEDLLLQVAFHPLLYPFHCCCLLLLLLLLTEWQ